MTDPQHRRRPTSRGPHGSLWAAVRRLARGNDADYAEWDEDTDDDHHGRRRPMLVTTYGATWRGLRPWEAIAPRSTDDAPVSAPRSPRAEVYGDRRAAILAWLEAHGEASSTEVMFALDGGNRTRTALWQMAEAGLITRVGIGRYAPLRRTG